jgi:hypothetical protein
MSSMSRTRDARVNVVPRRNWRSADPPAARSAYADAKLPSDLKRQQDPAGGRTRNDIDAAFAESVRKFSTDRFRVARPPEQVELLDIAVAVLARSQQKMTLH